MQPWSTISSIRRKNTIDNMNSERMVCACARARVRVYVCVRACVSVCVRVCECLSVYDHARRSYMCV